MVVSQGDPLTLHEEEQELVDYTITCSNICYPKKQDKVIGIVLKTPE